MDVWNVCLENADLEDIDLDNLDMKDLNLDDLGLSWQSQTEKGDNVYLTMDMDQLYEVGLDQSTYHS